ncbi:hypothetical protein CSHISOI_01936 [Colletotrichum shisoi]|uniref:Pheromone alpha factor receptor n=1 Tax=Colletotrichum shisoi TaxID=2078593 RepID=A0A5Q4C4T9_9PEZI|nr:hypothetical protein CSHISOI_01936 [Colletotrichum shisoi]
MDNFDPFQQNFSIKKADNETLVLGLAQVNALYQDFISTSANYGSQIGASFMLLLTIIVMMPPFKLVKVSLWLQITGLVLNIVRMTLLAVHFTSNWSNIYCLLAADYSHISLADHYRSVATEAISLLLHILVQVSLGIQAWALVSLLPGLWKRGFTGFSCFVSAAAITLRVWCSIVNIKAIMSMSVAGSLWISQSSGIVGAVSITYYCALFNIKLLMHLVKNRGILPSRQGMSAMEILIITNGLLMIIPVVFAVIQWGSWINFESGSLTYTSVLVFLPLGSLIASRVSCGTPRRSCRTTNSSAPPKVGLNSGPSTRIHGSTQGAVTSHIESVRVRPRPHGDVIGAESQRIIDGDPEEGFIRVDREMALYEERI